MGASLFQTDEKEVRLPLRFWSRPLNEPEKHYSVTEKGFLAVLWALSTFLHYLLFEKFIVHTDHSSLIWLMNVTDPSGRLIRCLLRLGEFNYEIKYNKGLCDSQSDALSPLTTNYGTIQYACEEFKRSLHLIQTEEDDE